MVRPGKGAGMRGEVTKLHPLALGTGGSYYQRVEFRLEGGDWAKTDLVPTFANYARWKPFLSVGAVLGGLRLRKPGEVDADSFPVQSIGPLAARPEPLTESPPDRRHKPLSQQLASAKRELALRRSVYPGWIRAGKLSADKAQHEGECMAAIVETLERMLWLEEVTAEMLKGGA